MARNKTLTILLGFGGSGGKTIASLMRFMAHDPAATAMACSSTAIILCDTDENDMEQAARAVRAVFSETGLSNPPSVHKFSLADDVDLFQDLVSERFARMNDAQLKVARQHWWFESTAGGESTRPFSASDMPENVNRGAAQCPLVSHFLAWDKLQAFERLLETVLEETLNRRDMENFSVDLFVVGSLAGGTGRGCWQVLSLKAREFFWKPQGGRRACRPIGFFFDSSVFADVMAQRPEQRVKLEVNNFTGLSELAMWLRSRVDIESSIAGGDAGKALERRFVLPHLADPCDENAHALDTDRYMPQSEEARAGRSPIHRAYLFTRQSRSVILTTSDHAFQIAAAAMYGRLAIAHARSTDANEPERACATATSILYVPISNIRQCVLFAAREKRVRQLLKSKSFDASRLNDASADVAKFFCLGSASDFSALAKNELDSSMPLSVLAHSIVGRTVISISDTQTREHSKREVLKKKIAAAKMRIRNERHADKVGSVFWSALHGSSESARSSGAFETKQIAADIIERIKIKHVATSMKFGIIPALDVIQQTLNFFQDQRASFAEMKAVFASTPSPTPATGDGDEWLKEHFGLFSRFKGATSSKFKRTLAGELGTAAFPGVLEVMITLVDEIVDRLTLWGNSLANVKAVYENTANSCQKSFADYQKRYFTVMPASGDEGRMGAQDAMRERLMSDSNSPVSKLIRPLYPIFEAKVFDTIVQELVEDEAATTAAQHGMSEFVTLEGLSSEPRSARSTHEFRNQIQEKLQSVIARQAIEFKELQRHFGLQKVLGDLADTWFAAWVERRGDAVFSTELDRQVVLITGISPSKMYAEHDARQRELGSAKSDLMAPRPESVLLSAALKLAASCDPFVQFEQSGDRRDRATVFLPDQANGDANKDLAARLSELGRERSDEFSHVKAGTIDSNFFMMVATSDLPKTRFAETGWDGWFSAPSDPQVRKWLEWAEAGVSAFKRDDGSVGLGYLSPTYIDIPHWSSRRWKPWVNPERQSIKMERRWYALAYALLGNESYTTDSKADWQTKYKEFVKKFNDLFGSTVGPNADHPEKLWHLPLLLEKKGDSRGPAFQRELFERKNGRLERIGLDIEEKWSGDISSMRKFVKWFESDGANPAIDAILKEQALFAELLKRDDEQLHVVTSKGHGDALQKWLKSYVSQWRDNIKGTSGGSEEDKTKQMEFLDRFEKFLDKTDLDQMKSFGA